jgi:protein-tyrosine sulfotransferase
MPSSYLRLVRATRLEDLPRQVQRVAGLPYLSRADFFPDISADEAARMAELSQNARGEGPAPILLFGVMPRSGTNFLRDLIAEHPGVHADPGRLYEFPLLQVASSATALMRDFVARFPRNAEVVSRWDALGLLAGAWLGELQREAGEKRILLKSPHVQNLTLAPHLFPGAKIVLCLRDGRDVIDSSLKTFSRWSLSRKTFGQLAQEWRLGAEAILAFDEGGPEATPDVTVVRYEELVADPEPALRGVFARIGLDAGAYDFAKVAAMPVRGSSRAKGQDDSRWQPQERGADFKPVRRWASWTPARKARFERIAGAVSKEAGYEPSA